MGVAWKRIYIRRTPPLILHIDNMTHMSQAAEIPHLPVAYLSILSLLQPCRRCAGRRPSVIPVPRGSRGADWRGVLLLLVWYLPAWRLLLRHLCREHTRTADSVLVVGTPHSNTRARNVPTVNDIRSWHLQSGRIPMKRTLMEHPPVCPEASVPQPVCMTTS